jgi:hypothetical protein
MDSDLVGHISKTKSKQLFYNAADDAPDFQVPMLASPKAEVRLEAPRVNPFALIEDRNAEMDRARREAALISDANQVLVKGPVIVKEETVNMENLPAIVRQLAQQAKLKLRR